MFAYAFSCAVATWGSVPFIGAREVEDRSETPETVIQNLPQRELLKEILLLVTREPGLDDVEIATRLRENPYVVSSTLAKMERDGLIEGNG